MSCAINKRGFSRLHLCRNTFASLWDPCLCLLRIHFDAPTYMVILVSSAFVFQTFAEVCYSVFVKRSSFKRLLNLRKAYIFQESAEGLLSICVCWIFQSLHRSNVSATIVPLLNLPSCEARRPLCHKINLSRWEARRRHFIMTCDIFGTGQTNILGLCYSFAKTYKQSTVAPHKSLKSTHSTKLLHLLRRTIRYH